MDTPRGATWVSLYVFQIKLVKSNKFRVKPINFKYLPVIKKYLIRKLETMQVHLGVGTIKIILYKILLVD